jgi:CheY-like chemotaxis protein
VTSLIVEDDPDALTLTERLMVARGHTVLSAADPHQASFVLAEHKASPDVLLTDLILAGHSGLEYAKL